MISRQPNYAFGRGTPGAAVPAYYSAATALQWSALPSSTFTSSGAGWSGTNPGGNDDWRNNFRNYSGACVTTRGIRTYLGTYIAGTFLICHGGGHNDYAGDDMYAYGPFDNAALAPQCYRMLDPVVPGLVYPTVRSGNHVSSIHTYNSIFVLPVGTHGKLIRMITGAPYNSVGAPAISDILDIDLQTWATNDTGYVSSFGGSGALDAVCGQDMTTGKVWALTPGNTNHLLCYNDGTVSGSLGWTNFNTNNPNYRGNTGSCCVPGKDILVQVGNSNQIILNDLRAGHETDAQVTPTTTGTAPSSGLHSLDYDSTGQRIVCWDNTGTAVLTLAIPASPLSGTWAWGSIAGSGGITPPAKEANSNGTWRRFAYIDNPRMVVLLSSCSAAMSFMPLT